MPEKTPLKAVCDGKIIFAGEKNGYGNTCILETYDGYLVIYGHLYGNIKKEGDTVKMGDKIAYSGNSGNSTGPHLHIGILKNDTYYNPKAFINFDE